jgi:penicillin-binding protein 2
LITVSPGYQTVPRTRRFHSGDGTSPGRSEAISTIKPFMALAALDSNAVKRSFTINDPGYFQLPEGEHKYRNWKRQGHGIVDLHRAIVVSNDT